MHSMSIKVMTYVWDGFPGGGSELLAMLALADWCNDQGGSLYPSMRAVAEKIRIGEKQARRIIHSFEAAGYLAVVGNCYGGAPGTTKQFKLNVAKLKLLAEQKALTPPAGVTPPLDVTPPLEGRDPSRPASETPPAPGSQTTIEPPIEPLKKKAQAPVSITQVDQPSDVTDKVWSDFLQIRKDKRAKLTDTAIDGIKREAAKAGLTLEAALTECCVRGWASFKADWGQGRSTTATQSRNDQRAATAAGLFNTGENNDCTDQHFDDQDFRTVDVAARRVG